MRFKSTLKGFLEQFVNYDASGKVVGVKTTASQDDFYQGLQDHDSPKGHIPLTPLEHITACLKALPHPPTNLINAYSYNFWCRVKQGNKLAYPGENWNGIYKISH